MRQIGGAKNVVVDENMLRHMILNSLRSYNFKFKEKYGSMTLCLDGWRSWRKSVFPNYKHSRKKTRDSSGLDWKSFFESLNKIQSEIKENLPYQTLQLETAEADDIIAVLTEKYAGQEKILIVSGDKDFGQLQKFPGVDQWRPVQKNFLKVKDPKRYLQDHILSGDTSDGIPNFLSDDDVFVVEGKRQKPLTSKKIDSVFQLDVPVFSNEEEKRGYIRNQVLIDFCFIPENIKKDAINIHESATKGNKQTLYNYMVVNRMRYLLERLNEF